MSSFLFWETLMKSSAAEQRSTLADFIRASLGPILKLSKTPKKRAFPPVRHHFPLECIQYSGEKMACPEQKTSLLVIPQVFRYGLIRQKENGT